MGAEKLNVQFAVSVPALMANSLLKCTNLSAGDKIISLGSDILINSHRLLVNTLFAIHTV